MTGVRASSTRKRSSGLRKEISIYGDFGETEGAKMLDCIRLAFQPSAQLFIFSGSVDYLKNVCLDVG
jgi:hypothetical protein